MRTPLRTLAGALVYDWLPFEWKLRRGLWTRVRNRRERIVPVPGTPGVACDWRWSSDLHVSRVFPSAGRRLMQAALGDWPVTLADRPRVSGAPDVAFVIGHRGAERIGHLLLTLASIAGQEDVACETLIVEQGMKPVLPGRLPPWVTYVHTPPPDPEMPYSRSWALNVGIREARAAIVIPGDNDLLVPAGYAREARNVIAAGADFADLKRFVFYLGEPDSAAWIERREIPANAVPLTVTQNLQGGTIAARRTAFDAVGGFDESLVGWGGEDNELWERAAALTRVSAGYLPFVHLWHAPQAGKVAGAAAPAILRYGALSDVPIERRIETIRSRGWGRADGPRGVL